MDREVLINGLFQALITGDRAAARSLVQDALDSEAWLPEELCAQVFWPALDMVASMHRADRLPTLAQQYAVRLLRMLVDQVQIGYDGKPPKRRTICCFCGPCETDELAAQIAVDLAEADGYEVLFAGGGVANDEIIAEVAERQADILLLFSSAASDAPHIRKLIDMMHERGACPDLQIILGGGIFNRAEGLAEEIGADLWAETPDELLEKLAHEPDRRFTPEQRTVGRSRNTRTAA